MKLPEDFLTHKNSWRYALTFLLEQEDMREEDRSYWLHELKAFDKAYQELEAQV